MEVAGIFLGPIFEMLRDKLLSLVQSKYGRQGEMVAQLEKLQKTLPEIRAVLVDAEDKQITDKQVKSWMDDLTDLAYDLDDLLDDFNTQTLRLQAESEASCSTPPPSKIRKLIQTCFTHSTTTKPDKDMMSKVEKLTERLQGIEIRKKNLGLKASVGGIGSTTAVSERRRETTSLEDKSLVYGREKDKEAILQLLLRKDESASVSVIPIVGMGGIGKTTLARLVYNDERIKGCFNPKLWVCVSDDYDVVRVTKAILEAFASDANKLETLNMLQQKLNEKLSGKRFLLVLDDVWNDNYAEWDVLRRPFMHGAPGSKIILTTRLRNVAKITSTLCPSQLVYTLNELSKDECLSLFAHHALGRANFDAHPHLKEIGEKIVNKCKGLPLAAKTLGDLLRNEAQQRVGEYIP